MTEGPVSVSEYLHTPETTRRFELLAGTVREPAAPGWRHQDVVLSLAGRLDAHVRRHDLGRIGVAPIDVVLDERLALVLQPDVLFVEKARLEIVRSQVWGAPDLVVEVLSSGSRQDDREQKLWWYRRYGVRKYWLVDPCAREITAHDFAHSRTRTFEHDDLVRSPVLPRLRVRVGRVFL